MHSMIRRDLEAVSRLAAEVSNGLPASELSAQVAELKTNGPLWRLKVNCLHYCRFVHHHHRLEDVAIFPTLRRVDPELNPVVDKLEADHLAVAERLAEVERSAEALTEAESTDARREVSAALDRLATELLEHLRFEEEKLEPALARMQRWTG